MDGSLALLFPTNWSLGIFLVLFGLFWDAGSVFVLVILISPPSMAFPAILLPILFCFIGIGLIIWGIGVLRESQALVIDHRTIKRVIRRFGAETATEVRNDAALQTRRVEIYEANGRPVHGAQIIASDGTLVIGHHLTDDEIGWIAHLIRAQAGPAQADGG